jgi:hypothetical protein
MDERVGERRPLLPIRLLGSGKRPMFMLGDCKKLKCASGETALDFLL